MWNLQHRKQNICITILTCVCLGNIFLYIAFTNLHAEYMRRKKVIVQSLSMRHEQKKENQGKQRKDERFLVNEPFLCNEQKVDLIIVVCSSLDHFKQRNAIRETWGNYTERKVSIKIVFLVGTWIDRRLSKINKTFSEEVSEKKDIVQGNFIDSYSNLTLKSIFMLRWLKTYCNQSKYILKTDDDMYINIPNLFRALNKQVITDFIMGNLIVGARPVQDKASKWYTPKSVFPVEFYPPYFSGTAYAISGSALPKLYNVSETLKPFWLEDVFITGLCAQIAGINHINRRDMTFNTPKPYGCTLKSLISGHKIKWQNMQSIHQEVVDVNSAICDKPK